MTPTGSMSVLLLSPLLASAPRAHGCNGSAAIVRGVSVRLMKPGKRTNGTPKPRYHVQQQRTTGSPTGREPYGDGVSIVAKGVPLARSSEGKQVTTTTRKRGTRDA
jgi:hypothetical protein